MQLSPPCLVKSVVIEIKTSCKSALQGNHFSGILSCSLNMVAIERLDGIGETVCHVFTEIANQAVMYYTSAQTVQKRLSVLRLVSC